jgi:hypothetical protein
MTRLRAAWSASACCDCGGNVVISAGYQPTDSKSR